MIGNEKELVITLDGLFKNHGFIRKRTCWYRTTEECISFFDIGKSPFGGQYEHVLGCFVKPLINSEKEFPEYYKAHLKFSIAQLGANSCSLQAFDLEDQHYQSNEREVILSNLITEYALPFLELISSKKGILEAVNRYPKLRYWINLSLKEHLKIPE